MDDTKLESFLATGDIKLNDNGVCEELESIIMDIHQQKNAKYDDLYATRMRPMLSLKKSIEVTSESYRSEEAYRLLSDYIDEQKEKNKYAYGSQFEGVKKGEVRSLISKAKKLEKEQERLGRISNEERVTAAIRVVKGKPMSFVQANGGKVNPNYSLGTDEVTNNCQCCVVAYELRRRGYDVKASLYTKDDDIDALAKNSSYAWLTKNGRPPLQDIVVTNGKSVQQLTEGILQKMSSPGRYNIGVTWEGKDYGHMFSLERKRNGTIVVCDPQVGKVTFDCADMNNLSSYNLLRDYLSQVDKNSFINILRVDDKLIRAAYIDKFVKKA